MSNAPVQKTPPRRTGYQRQPARQAPSQPPPADAALQQRAWAGVALAIISLIGLVGAFAVVSGANAQRSSDVDGVALVIAAAGVWLTATAMSRARRAGSARPRAAIAAMVLGIAGLVLTALLLPTFSSDAPQLSQFMHCMRSAGTSSAMQACQRALENSTGGG
jgi:4-amino-4-deoxy-L-arabinose transferase-like glycosyltransferase